MMACIPIHKSEILAALCIRRPSIHEHRSPVIVSLAFAEKSYRRRARGVDLRDDEQDLEQRHERHEQHKVHGLAKVLLHLHGLYVDCIQPNHQSTNVWYERAGWWVDSLHRSRVMRRTIELEMAVRRRQRSREVDVGRKDDRWLVQHDHTVVSSLAETLRLGLLFLECRLIVLIRNQLDLELEREVARDRNRIDDGDRIECLELIAWRGHCDAMQQRGVVLEERRKVRHRVVLSSSARIHATHSSVDRVSRTARECARQPRTRKVLPKNSSVRR